MFRPHSHVSKKFRLRQVYHHSWGYLKGKSCLTIYENHANLKYKYGNKSFCALGYYVSTVGLNKQTIQKYIREQETEDMITDKKSVKEYKDPFQW